MFAGMGVFICAIELKDSKILGGKSSIYSKKPFVIIIRQEPEKGQIKAALGKILPAKQ
jgi:hypothetical protein